jgi:hypothetical protein
MKRLTVLLSLMLFASMTFAQQRLQLNTSTLEIVVETPFDVAQINNIISNILPQEVLEGISGYTTIGTISPFSSPNNITVADTDPTYPSFGWLNRSQRKWSVDQGFNGGGAFDAIVGGTNVRFTPSTLDLEVEGEWNFTWANEWLNAMFPGLLEQLNVTVVTTISGFSSQATFTQADLIPVWPNLPWLAYDGTAFTLVPGTYNIEWTE